MEFDDGQPNIVSGIYDEVLHREDDKEKGENDQFHAPMTSISQTISQLTVKVPDELNNKLEIIPDNKGQLNSERGIELVNVTPMSNASDLRAEIVFPEDVRKATDG
jgi:hypothetical protein